MKKLVYKIKDTLSVLSSGKGFTLLELLVVVLIIGILAAIALPQYQLAMDKARYTQAMTLMATINQAQNRYFLTNGKFTTNFYDLDIEMPASGIIKNNAAGNNYFEDKWGNCMLHPTNYAQCSIKIGKGFAWYFLRWDSLYYSSNNRQCWVEPKNNARANRLCQALTGQEGRDHSGGGDYKIYNFY